MSKNRLLRKRSFRLFILIVGVTFFQTMQSEAQSSVTITGAVKNSAGDPLVGVSVRVKDNPSLGAVTNEKGTYFLTVPSGNETLVFSYIGFKTAEVNVKGKNIVNLTMQEVSSYMNTVIVTGYTSTLRKDLTGSVGTVDMSDLKKAPVGNFEEALAGRLAGVQVTSQSG